MQWIVLAAWSLLMVICIHWDFFRFYRMAMAAGLIASMGMQLALLWMDDMLTLETALPLHLCGLFGVLSIPLLFHPSAPLWELSAFLAAPAAACTLFFPAVIRCSHPGMMTYAFSQLHVLIALVPVFLWLNGKPLPWNTRRAFILGSGYLLFVWAFNSAFGTNYLFLRAAPSGTPLEWLLNRGTVFYVCSLSVLCMTVFSCLQGVFCRLNQRLFTAGNSSSCSRYSRCIPPWSSPNRG